LTHLIAEHLPDGKYDTIDGSLVEETKSAPKANTISERDFAQLDHFLGEKPNSPILSLEAMIFFCNDKTAKWLSDKTAERSELLCKAQSSSSELKQRYKVRKKKLIEDQAKLVQTKQVSVLRLQEKKMRQKESLTKVIMNFGLWQNEQHVKDGLAKLKSTASKLHALKIQLDFRHKVLEQCPTDKSIFHMSKNKVKLTVEEVCSNLFTLFLPPSTEDQEGLIGRRIKHKWNVNGSEQWYLGTILDVVPGTDDWYNVQYDNEDQVLSLNLLLDIEQGDLEFVT